MLRDQYLKDPWSLPQVSILPYCTVPGTGIDARGARDP
jgi:hypothetical protein